ncbi:MAG: SDR family NAD(P)-dependent oxidoreductase [Anaerolineae bacterium]
MASLAGKAALVIHAGRPVGRHIAQTLAGQGARVLAACIGEGARKTADTICAGGGHAISFVGDLTAYDTMAVVVGMAYDTFGRLDILVNAPGVRTETPLFGLAEAEFDAMMAADLKTAFNSSSLVTKRFREQKSGRIINVTSLAAFGLPNRPDAPTKAGLLGLTWTTANSMRASNVTANVVVGDHEVGPSSDRASLGPLVAYLAGDAAQDVSGQLLGVAGDAHYLLSQPKIIRTVRAENGWTVDALADVLPGTFGAPLPAPADASLGLRVGLATHADLPPAAWREVAPGVRFWSVLLPSDSELR